MSHFERDGCVAVWQNEPDFKEILNEKPFIQSVTQALSAKQIAHHVFVDDVRALLERETPMVWSTPGSSGYILTDTSINWFCYHRLNVIYNFLDELALRYPDICSTQVIGKTAEGRDMKLIKISNGGRNNKSVWVDGTIHAREWISASVVTYIINELVTNFTEQPDSVTKIDWYILPLMNPDGYEYTHTTDRLWRKNRQRYGEHVGVDLNRNFSVGFGEKFENDSSHVPDSIFYRGPHPFSEAETAAVRNFIMTSEHPFSAFVSFHSYGEVIIFPWGYTENRCPDYLRLHDVGERMAKAIEQTTGKIYKVGSTKDLMYHAPGVSTDWSYHEAGIPFSYMVEMRDKDFKFELPTEQIIPTCEENWAGLKCLVEEIDRQTLRAEHFEHFYT